MEAFLALIGLVTMFVGVVGLIRPLPSLQIPDRKRAGLVLAGGIVILTVAANLAPPRNNDVVGSAAQQSTAQAAAAKSPPKPSKPAAQVAFIEAVVSSREAFRQAPNELAKGGVRAQRREKICGALNSAAVDGWQGRIVELGSNNEGKGVLAVEIAEDVTLATWNNALSDLSHHTLIDPGSALFAGLAGMTKGQKVLFSGNFFAGDTDCVAEQSMTLSGSMRKPEFVFRFSRVDPQ